MSTNHNNLELLSDVFDAAYKAMLEAQGNIHKTSKEYYVSVETVVKAATDGAEKAMKEMMDSYRTRNK